MSVIGCFVLPHPPIIIHDIGQGEEQAIIKTIESFRLIAKMIGRLKPDTIILSSPHAPFLKDHFFISSTDTDEGNLEKFGAKQLSIKMRNDTEFIQALCMINKNVIKTKIPVPLDHGVIVPMSFVYKEIQNFKFVRLGLSGLDRHEHIQLGQHIRTIAQNLNRRVVFIASGDMSHRLKADGPYGLHPSGPRFDQRITELLSKGHLEALSRLDPDLCDEAAECGYRSLLIMSGVLKDLTFSSKLESYEDVFGVGYACASFIPQNDPYVELAKQTIRSIILDQVELKVPESTPQALLNTKAGVFVSIHKQGHLRGCIGTISPTKSNVAQEIITCAIWASTEDYRFSPIRADELDQLEVHVDVLGQAENIDGPHQLDPKRYGVIVSKGHRKGLLLPDLDGVDSVQQQISIALQKGGISDHEDYLLQRFEVIRHHD
ncbi:MAG: hypothetical protein FD133_461 [Erysipelotrichaceae bacterium]|nr:MAG: hypothetical protein FD179_829 [Erysipelotrichaceae bacterium]TXT19191.1 MAG: hypothetical protein FD133_461 [Erysipelotrichaceae bacterium]